MNLKHEINRLSHLFNDGLEQAQSATGEWSGQAKSAAQDAAGRARHGLRKGVKNYGTAEEMVLGHVRSNSNLYIAAALVLVIVAVSKLLIASRDETLKAPLL